MKDAIGRYRIVRKLGEGGMGIVYAAHDADLDRAVALKTIRDGRLDAGSRERFRREARSAARVNHPNVCQVYEIGEHEGQLYIVMELLEGESLAALIARGPIPLAKAIALELEILAALDALHRRDIVHRDLKPSNIFLTPSGLKVLDFGLARAVDGAADQTDARMTQPGVVLGSPAYMSPEQAFGQAVDARADLFAAGAIFFEMLVGRPPYTGTAAAVLHAVMHEPPPAIGGSMVIGAADRVIRRALAKNPEHRYDSAGTMVRDVESLRPLAEFGEVPRAHPITRLIVLPFRLLRPDADTDFLAFSLADVIATTLAGLEFLVVRSSMMASRFSSEMLDPKKIATEAEVDVVLTGTILRAGDQVRVGAQLLTAPEGTILWSETSQAPLGDLFQVQDQLARRIVESLAVPLTGREHRQLGRDVPASAGAFELYLRANQHFYHPRDWTLARDLYLACLKEDPRYAPAWARLGRCHRLAGKYATSAGEVRDNLARADAAFRKALEIDPDLPSAHNLYTYLEVDLGRAQEAMVRLLGQARARQADPELFAGLVHACRYCGLLDASVAAHEWARRLDPQVPTSVAHTYWMMGEYPRAADDPFAVVGYVCGLALASMGRDADAIAMLRERERSTADNRVRPFLISLRALLEGDRVESVRALEQAAENLSDPEALFYLSRSFARIGEADRALAELARVVRGGFFCASILERDPWLDPLRRDARFTTILRDAESRHRDAAAKFVEAAGLRILGPLAG